MKRAAIATIAASAISGAVIGTLPVTSPAPVRPTVTTVDPAQLYNAAQEKFTGGDVAAGLEAIKQVLAVAPADSDALALQAVWSDQVQDASSTQAALKRLSVLNPALASSVRNIIAAVADAAGIVPDASPKTVSGRSAIVVLGYGLNQNGTMAPELVKRVSAGKSQADATPALPIVVTGGVPRKGITEASAMKKWLIDNEIDAARITPEDKSGSTVANAQNTASILRPLGIGNVVLVTSPSHIRRAAADFGATGLRVVSTVTTATDLAKYQTPLSRDQQKGIRLEATRVARIPVKHQIGAHVPELPNELPDTGPGLIVDLGSNILRELMGAGSSALSGQ